MKQKCHVLLFGWWLLFLFGAYVFYIEVPFLAGMSLGMSLVLSFMILKIILLDHLKLN